MYLLLITVVDIHRAGVIGQLKFHGQVGSNQEKAIDSKTVQGNLIWDFNPFFLKKRSHKLLLAGTYTQNGQTGYIFVRKLGK